jgi:hypothetical protein
LYLIITFREYCTYSMNLKPVFYTLLLLSFITTACKKSSGPVINTINLEGIYEAANVQSLAGTYMYTVNGQVTNKDTIIAYLSRHTLLGTADLNAFGTSAPYNTDNEQVTFLTNGQATLSRLVDDTTQLTQFKITQKAENGFVLAAVDSTFYAYYPYGLSRSEMLDNEANTLSPAGNCYTSINVCSSREQLPFVIKNNQLYLNRFSLIITTYNSSNIVGSISGSANYGFAGSFNTDLPGKLIAGDTVVYQNATVLFTKKP